MFYLRISMLWYLVDTLRLLFFFYEQDEYFQPTLHCVTLNDCAACLTCGIRRPVLLPMEMLVFCLFLFLISGTNAFFSPELSQHREAPSIQMLIPYLALFTFNITGTQIKPQKHIRSQNSS